MTQEALSHEAVLCEATVKSLITKKDGVYVDNTFGRGGHSQAILDQLSPSGRLIAFDKDPEAVVAGMSLSTKDKRFRMVHADFVHADKALDGMGIGLIDGALFDLGVSSPQLDDPKRGFSFRFDAPLDMRMDTTCGITVSEWINSADEKDIKQVIKTYGEERFAGKIASAIVASRRGAPINTTRELAALVAKHVHTREPGKNPATRTFQALRIFINDELNALSTALQQTIRRLVCGGKLVVISFHSLEDRIVKRFMRFYRSADHFPQWANVRQSELQTPLLATVERPHRATKEEIIANPRARSAILRVASRSKAPWVEKVDGE